MRIWVTRAEPGAGETAERLRALGHEPVVAPVLEVRRLAPDIDLDGVSALAFTSRNGVEAFAALSGARDLPVFVVGGATAKAARAAGFASVTSAAGDVEALATIVDAPGAVLCPGAAEPAADLPSLLRARGLQARSVAVYETDPLRPPVPQRLGAVLIHSPKAARVVATLVEPASPLLFACISENAARPLLEAGHEKVLAARFPDEAGLLKLLEGR